MGFILWDDWIIKEYRENKEFARLCLQDAVEEWGKTGDIRLLIITLKQLARAYRIKKLSKDTGIGISTLDKSLSSEGNPTAKTLSCILKTLNDYCNEKAA